VDHRTRRPARIVLLGGSVLGRMTFWSPRRQILCREEEFIRRPIRPDEHSAVEGGLLRGSTVSPTQVASPQRLKIVVVKSCTLYQSTEFGMAGHKAAGTADPEFRSNLLTWNPAAQ